MIHIIKKLREYLRIIEFYIEIYIRKNKNKSIIKNITPKKQINVVFLVLYDSIWKCDDLFHKMCKDSRFNPMILICPIINYGKENMIFQMEKSYNSFLKKGYSPILSYNKEKDTYLDLEIDLQPDIVFYTNPYDGLIDDRYNIKNIKSTLTCYIPYFYNTSQLKMFYDLPFHRMLWCYFIETDFHLNLYKKSSKFWNYSNCEVVGYSVFDDFKTYETQQIKPFKRRKRVIWAPHHTINDDDMLKQSSFLLLYNVVIDLCKKYSNQIEFIFRPHPLLKLKLYKRKDWGKLRTDEYYNLWNEIENGKLSDGGDYIPEFYQSDAIIHDCGSFLCEYLYTEKPAIYFSMHEEEYLPTLNDIAKEAYHSHYIVYDLKQLINQFEETIINDIDPFIEKRQKFKNTYLKISENYTSDIIINKLREYLFINE